VYGLNPLSNDRVKLEKTVAQDVLYSFPRGTSAGPSGLSSDVLKELSKISDSKVTEILTWYGEKFMNGDIKNGHQYITGSRLIGFNKGENDVRPIAVGETLRRFIAKWALKLVDTDIRQYFADLQYGVADPRGAEKVIHGIREYYSNMGESSGIMKIDIENAFNSIERVSFLKEVSASFQRIERWVFFVYSNLQTYTSTINYSGLREASSKETPWDPCFSV